LNIIQTTLLCFDLSLIAVAASGACFLVYDIVTSIRAWMKRRKEYTGKEEPHNGISESGR